MELVEKRKEELVVEAHVIYFDEYRRRRNALVTAVHGDVSFTGRLGEGGKTVEVLYIPCVNLVIVVPETDRTDQYGRQTDHPSSVMHASDGRVGRYFCFPDEEADNLPLEEKVATQT